MSTAQPRVAGTQPRIVAGSLFALAITVIAATAAWPIYRSGAFVVLVAVAVGVGSLIAILAWRLRWRTWIVALVVALAFVLFGIPLAVPSRLGDPSQLVTGLAELASGAIVGWKDLVTVDLPVGSYRNLLVPALVVFLVGTVTLLLLAWRADRVAYFAAPVAIVMVSFGLFFGRTTVSVPWRLGAVTLYAPIETALGIAGLVACLLWLAWRTHAERIRALQRAANASGVRITRRTSPADRRRTALGAAMIAGAVAVAVAIVPYTARGEQREVLRTAIGPEVALSQAVSPLTEYRSLFAAERDDQVLFTVESSRALPERVRLATLDRYDGETFRAGGAEAIDDARFVRVPAVLDAGEGETVDVRVGIEGLDGIWMPTAGSLSSVEFTGARAASLADGFYYSTDSAAGVQTAGGGLRPGDAYRLRGVEVAAADLAELDPPRGLDESVAAPASLRTWVQEHATGSGGAALASLVSLLRERGYLSHALDEPAEQPAWMQAMPGYSFQSSASGHSLARVDALFDGLLQREADPRAQASGNFVAAVGDDEQFATAVALVARELGFPARVVVGARLVATDSDLPACDDGVCRAHDIAAWTEVQSADGEWVAIDVTPQHVQSPSLETTVQRDPEIVTEVLPDPVEQILPPDPVQQDTALQDDRADEAGLDLALLWPVLRITGIVILVLALVLGPFVAIILAKASRRRARRRSGTPAERVASGWEEYADAAADAGHATPRWLTRSELAAAFATPGGADLAAAADRAVFAGTGAASDADATAFWHDVDAERRELVREHGFWRRLAATVSLRSFVRQLAPSPGVGAMLFERGRRRAPEPVRSTP